MKRIITIISILFTISTASFGQVNVLCENFTGYDSSSATANWHGWTFNYFSQYSFYTTVSSSGPSGPNSYKFGVDSATLITPDISGADHINFWMKGNAATGHTLANGKFYIYESSDGVNYTLIDMIYPITPFLAQTKQYALSAGTVKVKFYYEKDSGNVAFDDFCATIGAVGINDPSQIPLLSIYPNPSKGITTIELNNLHSKNTSITVSNVLGKEIKKILLKNSESICQLDLTEFKDGVYFVNVKSDAGQSTQRIVLRK